MRDKTKSSKDVLKEFILPTSGEVILAPTLAEARRFLSVFNYTPGEINSIVPSEEYHASQAAGKKKSTGRFWT